jgi:hypothetical protein
MNTWNERQEKALMEAVEWVDSKFPGEDGQEIMSRLGGRWELVAQALKRELNLDVTGSACKTRFYQIRKRVVFTIKDGQDVVVTEDTEFPQVVLKDEDLLMSVVNPRLVALEKRMTAVEKQLKNNQDVTNLVQELNDSFQDFFKNYG